MALLTGLEFGRPAYPYYEPDAFKPYEPKAMGILASLAAKSGKSVTSKNRDDKIKGTWIQEKDYYTQSGEIEAKQKEIFNRWKPLYDKDPNGWQNTPEGQKIVEDLTSINNMINIQKSNPNLMIKNAELLIAEETKLTNPENYAQDQYMLTTDENGDPSAVKTKKVYNGQEYDVPIRKIDVIHDMQTNPIYGRNASGQMVVLDPPRAVNGLSGMKALQEKYVTIQSAIREGEGDQYVVPITPGSGASAASYAGKIMTQSIKSGNNLYALQANTVQNFLNEINPDELESLKQSYVNIKENNPNFLIYEEVEKKDGKEIKTKTKLDFYGWVGSLLTHENQRNMVSSAIKDQKLIDLPNVWGAGASNGPELYSWQQQAQEGSGIDGLLSRDPLTGNIIPGIPWSKTTTDIIENVMNISADDIKKAITGISVSPQDEMFLTKMHQKMLDAKKAFMKLGPEERNKYGEADKPAVQLQNYVKSIVLNGDSDSEEILKRISKGYKTLTDEKYMMPRPEELYPYDLFAQSSYRTAVKLMGGSYGNQTISDISGLSYLDEPYTKKYGSSIATTLVPYEYQNNSALYLRDLVSIDDLNVRTFGGKTLTKEAMSYFARHPFINNIDQFGYLDGKGKQEGVFLTRIAVHEDDIDKIPIAYWDGKKYVESTYGKLGKTQKMILGILDPITISETNYSSSDFTNIAKSGWKGDDAYYNVPVMINGKNIVTDFWKSTKFDKTYTSTYPGRMRVIDQGQQAWEKPGVIE